MIPPLSREGDSTLHSGLAPLGQQTNWRFIRSAIAGLLWGAIALVGSSVAIGQGARDEPTREQATQAQINALKAQIAQVQRSIERKRGEKDQLQNRLQKAEKAIAELDLALAQTEAAIAAELPKLEQLDRERDRLRAEVEAEQATMSDEMRNLWALRQGGGLRILLGDQNPDRLARNLAYYRRLLESRGESVQKFEALLVEVARNTEAIQASQTRLAKQRTDLKLQRNRAQALQEERRVALADIERSLTSDAARVKKLEGDAAQLTELLEELRQTLAELDTPASYKPFSEAKGMMQPPTAGKPSNRYGAPRNAGNLRWRGWMITAREGSDVQAIHHGRVVYADWLPGQGLLVVLDHGEGYLSLYGHNRSLQREVGDWVRPGDTIAKVGATGGFGAPGLYFEIRHEGEPVDPGKWIKR